MKLLSIFVIIIYSLTAQTKDSGTAYIKVQDGDTFTLNGEKIRLWGIDAPELLQPFGFKCRDDLTKILAEVTIGEITRKGKSYQRTVADVKTAYNPGGYSDRIAVMILNNGCAMVDPRYAPNDRQLFQAQNNAILNGVGIWAEEDPEPPWEYRRRIKEDRKKVK